MRTTRPVRTAAATAALALTLVACADSAGDEGDPAAPATTVADADATHNAADATFLREMVPHHRQAVMMSELVAENSDDPEVVELGEEISAGQGPEIETMTALLEAWGEEPPGGHMGDGMDGMGMDGTAMEGMAGMMTPEQMAGLTASEGEAFDRMFLEMMIVHHEGAIEMAQAQLEEGMHPDALQLAEEIRDAQEQEIERMHDMLGTP